MGSITQLHVYVRLFTTKTEFFFLLIYMEEMLDEGPSARTMVGLWGWSLVSHGTVNEYY